MSVGLVGSLYALAVVTSFAIVVVALVRKPLRRFAGARTAYWLWVLVPSTALIRTLPMPPSSQDIGSKFASIFVTDAIGNFGIFANPTDPSPSYAAWYVAIWLCGCIALLAFLGWRQRSFSNSMGHVVALEKGVYRSTTASGPALVGLFYPRIVLPANFESVYSEKERSLILAHEIAHRRRGDHIVNAIAMACLCCFWFNPLMYWAIHQLKFDQELACDESVLAAGQTTRRLYASALLKSQLLADSWPSKPIACLWQSNHPLKERIAMLRRDTPNERRRVLGAALTLIVIVSVSHVLWLAQPRPALAQPTQASSNSSVVAAAVLRLENGDYEMRNIVVKGWERQQAGFGVSADRMIRRDDGSILLEGEVRLTFEATVLTTSQAIIEPDGTLRASLARVSMTPGDG